MSHAAPTGQKSGTLISQIHGTDKVTHTDTISCCHCGRVWIWEPGSGRRRGFCLRCNAFHCGSVQCCECRPVEQLLENIEQGRPKGFTRIIVAASSYTPIPKG
jgi:hypothetical protein